MSVTAASVAATGARRAGRTDAMLAALLTALGALAPVAFAASLRFQSLQPARPLSWGELAGFLLLWLLLALALGRLAGRISDAWLGGLLDRLSTPLWVVLLAGLGLRMAVALALQPQPASDGASYLALAAQLAAGEPYATSGMRAYWPPGMALALAPLVHLLGPGLPALLGFGLLSYLIAACGTWQLARRLGLERWASVPVWLLCLWPSHVLCSGLPEKELLVIALLPWVLLLGHRALLDGGWWRALGAGLLLGAAVLIQPSMQLLPLLALPPALWLLRGRRLRTLALFALVIAGMLAAIAPWTLRNYQVLGQPVLISTNGGSNLYRANNDLATGAYTLRGSVDLDALDELAADREGKRLAFAWIAEHPQRFAQLGLTKLMLYAGDDSYGAYAALKRGIKDVPPRLYQAVKLLAALPWLLTWLLIAWAALRLAGQGRGLPGAALLVALLPFTYLLGLHMVFESGGKYHLPALAPTLVALALLLKALREGRPC